MSEVQEFFENIDAALTEIERDLNWNHNNGYHYSGIMQLRPIQILTEAMRSTIAKITAQGIDVPAGIETTEIGSTEGESPVRDSECAQNPKGSNP